MSVELHPNTKSDGIRLENWQREGSMVEERERISLAEINPGRESHGRAYISPSWVLLLLTNNPSKLLKKRGAVRQRRSSLMNSLSNAMWNPWKRRRLEYILFWSVHVVKKVLRQICRQFLQETRLHLLAQSSHWADLRTHGVWVTNAVSLCYDHLRTFQQAQEHNTTISFTFTAYKTKIYWNHHPESEINIIQNAKSGWLFLDDKKPSVCSFAPRTCNYTSRRLKSAWLHHLLCTQPD